MNGATLTCPSCSTVGIALGASGCPTCGVPFAQIATPAPMPAQAQYAPMYQQVQDGAPTQPEVDSDVEYATLGQRFLAGLVDYAIWSAISVAIFGFDSLGFSAEETGVSVYVMSGSEIAWMLVDILVFAAFHASVWQASPGMKLMRLRVVHADDYARISFGRALVRGLASYLSWFIIGIGYLMIAFTKRNQGLHDMLASTVVLRDPPR